MATEMVHDGRRTSCDTLDLMHAATHLEAAIRFIDWADNQRNLTAQSVIDRFEMTRSTAFRWVAAYRAARGQA